jgi:hypothetical protein
VIEKHVVRIAAGFYLCKLLAVWCEGGQCRRIARYDKHVMRGCVERQGKVTCVSDLPLRNKGARPVIQYGDCLLLREIGVDPIRLLVELKTLRMRLQCDLAEFAVSKRVDDRKAAVAVGHKNPIGFGIHANVIGVLA